MGMAQHPNNPGECNGNGEHMAILYGSEPCPLCASHAEIERLRTAASGVVEYVNREPDCCPSIPLWGLIKHLQVVLDTPD